MGDVGDVFVAALLIVDVACAAGDGDKSVLTFGVVPHQRVRIALRPSFTTGV